MYEGLHSSFEFKPIIDNPELAYFQVRKFCAEGEARNKAGGNVFNARTLNPNITSIKTVKVVLTPVLS